MYVKTCPALDVGNQFFLSFGLNELDIFIRDILRQFFFKELICFKHPGDEEYRGIQSGKKVIFQSVGNIFKTCNSRHKSYRDTQEQIGHILNRNALSSISQHTEYRK